MSLEKNPKNSGREGGEYLPKGFTVADALFHCDECFNAWSSDQLIFEIENGSFVCPKCRNAKFTIADPEL